MKTCFALLSMLAVGSLAFTASVAAVAVTPAHVVYVAHLHALNTGITKGQSTGEARFIINGDRLTIQVSVQGAPPDMTHWQHFHGFTNGQAATCATAADDVNHDGIVDLIETEKASGTTMVPFDTTPAAMDIAHGIYPKADAKGDYHYQEVVPLKTLETAFAKAYPGQKLDLDRRVVYIHGVPSSTKLPSTVKSLGPVPAQVTLPIACGRIERVGRSAR